MPICAHTAPGFIASRTPCPIIRSVTVSAVGSSVSTTVAPATASAGSSSARASSAAMARARRGLRFQTLTFIPAPSKRRAIADPIVPSPSTVTDSCRCSAAALPCICLFMSPSFGSAPATPDSRSVRAGRTPWRTWCAHDGVLSNECQEELLFVIRMIRLGAVELRQLEHFVAVAEDGSFTRAARRLNYVQSALSVSVQALERELGVRLFDRSTHRVNLTGAGEALLPAARRTLAAAEETRDIAASVKGVLRGKLRVGIMQSFAFSDVPALLGRFHHQHPGVEIQVRPAAGGSAALLDDLRQGALDIAFVAVLDRPSGVSVHPLGSETLALFAAPGRAPAGRGAVSLSDLVDATFVDFPAGWGVRTAVDRAFAAAGLERRITIEIADVGTCLAIVRAGLGFALFPPSLVPPGEQLVRRAVSPRVTWHVAMVRPSGRSHAAADALAELVTQDQRVSALQDLPSSSF
jgi:DNA-binding transcriptional LysR family regulator